MRAPVGATLLVAVMAACTGRDPTPPAPAPAVPAQEPGPEAQDTAVGPVGRDTGATRRVHGRSGERARDTAASMGQVTAEPRPVTDPTTTAPAAPAEDAGAAGAARAAGAVGEPTAAPAEALPVPLLPGAVLPFSRIVAFYGNPASPHMGILGELPPDELLERLDQEVAAWRVADPHTPVRPALQMIAVMATGDPGRDSLFRLRLPDSRIREVADWAERRDALLFLDVQPGQSTVEAEVPPLEKWLARPDVHLALDPEWTMPPGAVPGQVIGSLGADEINFAIDFLADLVDRYHLPPKVLVVHRFTSAMIRDAPRIRRDPRVQVVVNMDGWGSPPQKRAAYRDIVAPEADQFTGFKLFFRNDRRDGAELLRPEEILGLDPPPVYIQYQ